MHGSQREWAGAVRVGFRCGRKVGLYALGWGVSDGLWRVLVRGRHAQQCKNSLLGAVLGLAVGERQKRHGVPPDATCPSYATAHATAARSTWLSTTFSPTAQQRRVDSRLGLRRLRHQLHALR